MGVELYPFGSLDVKELVSLLNTETGDVDNEPEGKVYQECKHKQEDHFTFC